MVLAPWLSTCPVFTLPQILVYIIAKVPAPLKCIAVAGCIISQTVAPSYERGCMSEASLKVAFAAGGSRLDRPGVTCACCGCLRGTNGTCSGEAFKRRAFGQSAMTWSLRLRSWTLDLV